MASQAYTRRVVIVAEAIQLKADGSNIGEIQDLVPADLLDYSPEHNRFSVKSPYGKLIIEPGDYVVVEENGDVWAFIPVIFEAIYKPAEEVV